MNPATTAPTWGLYEQLLPAEIESIFARTPVAYLPWGALEYHGKHAAVGLDGLKAHGLCVELAKAAGGLVLPPVYIAANTIKEAKDLAHRRHSQGRGGEVQCRANRHEGHRHVGNRSRRQRPRHRQPRRAGRDFLPDEPLSAMRRPGASAEGPRTHAR